MLVASRSASQEETLLTDPNPSRPRKRANGEGTFYRRSDGYWEVAFCRSVDGRKVRTRYYYKTEEEAWRGLETRKREFKQAEAFRRLNANAKPKERRTYSFGFLPASPGVYFIQALHKGSPIKIGVARNLRRRLMDLQAACPYQLSILHIVHGAGRTEEVGLHERFSYLRLHGEWFMDDGAIKAYLAGL